MKIIKESEKDGDTISTPPDIETGNPLKLNFSHYFLFFLIFIVLVACYNIIKPYLHPIVLAVLLAVVFNPVHRRIVKCVRGHENLGAFLSCLFLSLVVVLPTILITFALIRQGIQSINSIQEWIIQGGYTKLIEHQFVIKIMAIFETFLPDVQKFFPDIDPQKIKSNQILLQMFASAGKTLVNHGGQLAGNIAILSSQFFLMMFTFFFMIRDEKIIFKSILHLVPLNTRQENQIMSKIRNVAKSALLGTLVTSVAQGMAGGIAFWISDLPGFFWGMVMAFASLIPLVGTALIWIPAALYLFLSGSWGYGIFMVLWCVIIVQSIDNFVRPFFMQGSADMSTLVIFFAILGGVNYFGLIGLLYGPLIFSLALVLLYIYKLEFEPFLNHQDSVGNSGKNILNT